MADYNGYPNRATWNVSLWLNNDEPTYRAKEEIVKRADCVEGLANDLEGFCNDIWPNGCTPDRDLLSECDWDFLARSEADDAGMEAPNA